MMYRSASEPEKKRAFLMISRVKRIDQEEDGFRIKSTYISSSDELKWLRQLDSNQRPSG